MSLTRNVGHGHNAFGSRKHFMGLRSAIGPLLSPPIKNKIRIIEAAIELVRSGGTVEKRECNICGYRGYFYPCGINIRRDAGCPKCNSLERHRLLKLYFDAGGSKTVAGKSVLHFAAEPSVSSFIKPSAARYVTADLFDPNAELCLNIENIELEQTFDVIIASHVLEHVDDKKALASVRNKLADGGILIAMVPIANELEKTFEDPTITSPKDRALYFGQVDHVRYYGRDFIDRVSSAGFSVERFSPNELEIAKFGLQRDTVFICCKKSRTKHDGT
jgi:SAM-dependent methyltransferase